MSRMILSHWKCNLSMDPHVRLLVGRLVIISLKAESFTSILPLRTVHRNSQGRGRDLEGDAKIDYEYYIVYAMHVCNYHRYEHVITYKSTNSLQTSFPAKTTMINYQNDGRKENEGSEAKKNKKNP